MSVLVKLCEISKSYPQAGEKNGREKFALEHISLSINKGEYVAIVGQSGSGKSTLMNLLGCLDAPTSGEIFLAAQTLQENNNKNNNKNKNNKPSLLAINSLNDKQLSLLRNREIGFVFQSFNLINSLTALENIELPLFYRNINKKERHALAHQALATVGLLEYAKHYPSQMSGGQQQRVAVARAIAASPPLILADEPTGNLDPDSAAGIIAIFRKLNNLGKTVIFITHDPKIAAGAGRIIRIKAGKILEDKYIKQN